MPVTLSDIALVLSGGVSNTIPSLSLGGNPSVVGFIADTIDNLFDNITGDQVSAGQTSYRCFYVFNDNLSSTFSNVKCWVDSQTSNGVTISLGIPLLNDVQNLFFNGTPTGGTFQLLLDIYQTSNINYSTNPSICAGNIQSGINLLPNAGGAVVVSNSSGGFTLTFSGQNSNRYFPSVTMPVNNLISPSPTSLSVTKITNGSPINLIAPNIGIATVPPTNVTFTTTNISSPIIVGSLLPTDGFPIWVKRSVSTSSGAMQNAGFTFKVSGNTF